MSTLIEADRIKYSCSCKRLKPLSNLYYCRHCKPFALKCKECVIHEVDQKYFCTNCFDNKNQKELFNVKHKCLNCYSCPCCKNLLMIRASSLSSSQKAQKAAAAAAAGTSAPAASPQPAQPPQSESPQPAVTQSSTDPSQPGIQANAQQPQQPQKLFYLMCGFCRWTTRDVGMPDIPDALTTPRGWKPLENPHRQRIMELLNGYSVISAREKQEKEKKKFPITKRRSFHTSNLSSNSGLTGLHTNINAISGSGITSSSSSISDKYGILSPVAKKLEANSSNNQQLPIEEHFRQLVTNPSTVDNFEPLPSDFYTTSININSFTTINQRHSNPEFQPSKSSDLYPLNKYFFSKESKRCNGCDHNVLKPESIITSIKFKLHQMAIFLVPEIRFVTIPEWKLNEPNEVILSITNRSENDINLSFLSFDYTQDKDSYKNLSNFKPNSQILFDVNGEEFSVQVDKLDNPKTQGPFLRQSDLDTNGFVCFRRDNKVAIKCRVIPSGDDTQNDQPPHVGCVFRIKYNFLIPEVKQTATSTPIAPSSSSTSLSVFNSPNPIIQDVFIDLGPLRLEDGLKVIPKPKYIEDCLNNTLNLSKLPQSKSGSNLNVSSPKQ